MKYAIAYLMLFCLYHDNYSNNGGGSDSDDLTTTQQIHRRGNVKET
jgi:hypothetical protein